MSADSHFDGGLLRPATVTHRHVVEHPDGRVSAIVVAGVPALVCDLCEEAFYEEAVTDAVVRLLSKTVAPGEAIAVKYHTLLTPPDPRQSSRLPPPRVWHVSREPG